MRKIVLLLFFLMIHINASEKTPLLPKLTHPLTTEQLTTYINDKNQLDLRKLGNDVFCTEYCCVSKFITLNNTHKGLKLVCAFDSDKTAKKFLQNLNQLSTNKKFNLYENPID